VFSYELCLDVRRCAVGLAAWNKQVIEAHEILGSVLDPAAQLTNTILTVKELLSPLSREEMKTVRCLGLNYSDHAVGVSSAIKSIVYDTPVLERRRPKWQNLRT